MKLALPFLMLALLGPAPITWAAPAAPPVSGERVLFDLRRTPEASRIQAEAAEYEWVPRGDGRALRVRTGTAARWPGVILKAPDSGWDFSPQAWIEFRVRNTGTNSVKVYARIDNEGADGTKNCVTSDTTLLPSGSGTLRVNLTRVRPDRLNGQLFGMRGYPVASGGEGTIDPTRVTQVLAFVSQPVQAHQFEIDSIVAGGEYTTPTAWTSDADPFLPFIDTFGQYRHKSWPGKTTSLEDLEERRRQEAVDLARQTGPEGWNQYGGWTAGPKLQATGFFRTTRHEGKWWLVDPEGRLFWSHGVDCVRSFDFTPIEERESWFESFPGADPALAEFVNPSVYALKGHYAGRSPRCFSFAGANLRRKYGPEWRTTYPDVIHRRLRAWGLNTIANWSDLAVAQLRRTPYTDGLHSRGTRMIEGSEGYWGKFPDVFDPGFLEGLRKEMNGKKGRSAGDPWCIGYFSDNEMSWGDDTSLAEAALRSPADQPAKRTFVADLQAKYRNVADLNQAWGTRYPSWDDLLATRELPDRARSRTDLEVFYSRVAETYFESVRKAIREVAPDQLYLGCRFAWVNARAAAAAAKHCDVVSFNLYQRSVAEFVFNGGTDVPLIIGEFHFGALDRGMFHTGLVPVSNQAARAEAYRRYVEGAVRHPKFVGCHWFQWQDEPTTGRVYDEENYQIGLVDIADTPYAETVAAVRSAGGSLYRLRLEKE